MGAKKWTLGLSIIRGLAGNAIQFSGYMALCKLGGAYTLVCYIPVAFEI